MIDLSPIKKYIIEPDSFMINFVQHEIKHVGLYSFLEYSFRNLDCSRIMKDGLRPMQTIGYPYIHIITEIIFTIENYIEKDKQDYYFEKLLDLHNKNLEYEKINPPIRYKSKRDKINNKDNNSNIKVKSKKQKDVNNSDKPKKQTAAEKKLAAKVAKINALSFKIKPQN